MKKMIISTVLVTCLSPSVFAQAKPESTDASPYTQTHFSEYDHVKTGVGIASGAAVGGAIANIPGAVVGGFIGSMIMLTKKHQDQIHADEVALADAKQQLETQAVSQTNAQETTEPAASPEQMTLLKEVAAFTNDISLDFNFKTAAADLSARDKTRLDQLVALMETYPSLSIQLDGYADKRGNAEYNLGLSEQRLASISNYLKNQGLPAERMTIVPHGNELSQEQDLDGFAFDRRVSISVLPEVESSLG